VTATDCPCQDPQDRERVEHMLKLAKTKADLQDLVRALDARNMRLQAVRDQLGIQLAHTRQTTAGDPQ
jgi:hypothetical protein